MRFLLALALTPALLLTSCGCLDISKGTMTVSTDCTEAGKFQSTPFTFQKLPDAAAKGLLSYFHISASQAQLDTVEKLLDCPSTGSFSCDARGAGLDQAHPSNLVTPGAALCGSKLIAVGPVGDPKEPTGFYVCNAPTSTVGDQLWIMQCQQFRVSTTNPSGTCHGIATYKIEAGL